MTHRQWESDLCLCIVLKVGDDLGVLKICVDVLICITFPKHMIFHINTILISLTLSNMVVHTFM